MDIPENTNTPAIPEPKKPSSLLDEIIQTAHESGSITTKNILQSNSMGAKDSL